MKNEILYKKLSKANELQEKAHDIISNLAKQIGKEKGFKNWKLFSADFATGNETIVSFNFECEMSDLDLTEMNDMTKKEIIDKFTSWYIRITKETVKLLNE